MLQSREVELRTEIAQLKSQLYQLRFALPLKKMVEEFIEAGAEYLDNPSSSYLPLFVRNALDQFKKTLNDKERYEVKDEIPGP